jgi:hypothetical protein
MHRLLHGSNGRRGCMRPSCMQRHMRMLRACHACAWLRCQRLRHRCRYLHDLLLVHGRWEYRRISLTVEYCCPALPCPALRRNAVSLLSALAQPSRTHSGSALKCGLLHRTAPFRRRYLQRRSKRERVLYSVRLGCRYIFYKTAMVVFVRFFFSIFSAFSGESRRITSIRLRLSNRSIRLCCRRPSVLPRGSALALHGSRAD